MNDNWHRTLICAIAGAMRPSCYLELGLGGEPTLTSVADLCVVAYGVDHNEPKFPVPANATIFTMSTDEFFDARAKTIPPPELVFVDADHRSAQVLKDLKHIEEICAPNCVVVCHDTYPENTGYTVAEHCADSYKVPDMIPWKHVTIPRHPGATILRMKPSGLA